jgi:pyruvate dehydrogenase E2 component (dihydrolipoamide acetyltransferase)
MAETITLPKLGFDMREGTFLNWVKKVGDSINKGDVIAEIESDKATIEVESTSSGVLLQTIVDAGDVVPVGAPIAVIGAAGEQAGSTPAKQQPAQQQQTQQQGQQAPAQPQPAQQQGPAKSGQGGTLARGQVPEEEGEVLPKEVEQGKQPVGPQPGQQQAQPAAAPENGNGNLPGGVKASPIARKMAEDKGIDLTQVKGSGPGGRITKSDVESFQPAQQPAQAQQRQLAAQPTGQQAPSGDGITEKPVSRLRQRIASRMVESKQTVPHFYVTSEIDMAPALELRKQINEGLPEEQKVSVNDLVIKAVALTLRQFPNLNSHYYGDKLVLHDYINIGIAVALENGGLMNVVAKDADSTSISRMAQRNREMVAAARSGKVRPEDVEGSTFTVSNLGPYDVESFVAIINPPEAGILAVGSARQVPVVINGEIKVGTRMKVTLSVDHRVSDGAEGAQFLQSFKKLLETPMRLLI